MTLGEKIYQAIMNINSDAQFVSKITDREKRFLAIGKDFIEN